MVDIVSSPEDTEQPKENPTEAAHDEMIRNYILDGTIEETYTHNKGLIVSFAVPTQGQLMQRQEEIDREIFANDEAMGEDRANMIRDNNLLAIYMTRCGDKDFRSEQGDRYYKKEGLQERKGFILSSPKINVYVMQWIMDKLTEFQQTVSMAFKEDTLKNS